MDANGDIQCHTQRIPNSWAALEGATGIGAPWLGHCKTATIYTGSMGLFDKQESPTKTSQ